MFTNISFTFSDEDVKTKATDIFTKSKDHLLAIPAFSELLEKATIGGVIKVHFISNLDQDEPLDSHLSIEFEDDMHNTISDFITILCYESKKYEQLMTQEEENRSEFEDSKLGFDIMAELNKTELKEYLGIEGNITHPSFEEFVAQKDIVEDEFVPQGLGELSLCSE